MIQPPLLFLLFAAPALAAEDAGKFTLTVWKSPTSGVDVAVEVFMAIPEPSSAVLWLLGAGGLAMRRRRWRS